MRRREFIALLGSVVAGWPIATRAQQAARPVIGFLGEQTPELFASRLRAFRQGLAESGYSEGRNVSVEYRWAQGQDDRLPALAADLVRQQVAVIATTSTSSALAAKAATTTVPIVFATGSDPVRDGLVGSLNRPGGNVTGVSFLAGALGAKRLDLLRQLAPKGTTIGVLVNPDSRETVAERRDVEAAAQAIRQQLIVLEVGSDREIEPAFATLVQRGAGALFIGTGAFMNSRRERLAALAAQHRIPAIYALRESVAAGGLMSYGTSITDAYRQVGIYTGRILKGEKPADLPVMQSTKFEFVINLRTAKALGLEILPAVLALADEVIE